VILVDVNVLVCAHREDAPDHASYRRWLEQSVASEPAFGLSEIVLSGFVRIVTHPRVFATPTPTKRALAAADVFRKHPNVTLIAPGPRHWEIFGPVHGVVRQGNLVADAYLAALAVESGSDWITTDRDYSRFPGLRWRHPLS
jgi:toxin-antitoxin system PIN domain toxin